MGMISLGRVSFLPKGEWESNTQYDFLDVVNYKGEGFVVRQKCQGVIPAEGEYYMKIARKGDSGLYYAGTCTTPAGTIEKTVTIEDFKLTSNCVIAVKFQYTNTAANPMLKINNESAKPILYEDKAVPTEYLQAKRIYEFAYDGTNFNLINIDQADKLKTAHNIGSASFDGTKDITLAQMGAASITDLNNVNTELQSIVTKIKNGEIGLPYEAKTSAPTNKNILWIDTANGGIMKYYDTTTNSWKIVQSTWG